MPKTSESAKGAARTASQVNDDFAPHSVLRGSPKTVLWVAALALALLFVWGLEQVAVAPLETGEVYPPYSSLRADPLGTKALYESLAGLDDLQVTRLYKPRTQIAPQSALVVLGLNPVAWDQITQKTLTEYENLVSKGGRLVLGFLPVHAPLKPPGYTLLEDRWKLRFRYRHEEDEATAGIPSDSTLYFEHGEEWTVVREEDASPVTVERSFGSGTIVLVAQIYPLSNEGLREDRDAPEIARLFGAARSISFDENHFGIEESGSVTILMRKYHLEPAIAVLLLTALLFLWRSASSLLPPRSSDKDQAVAGRDAQEGLVSLLERSLPEKDLLNTCFAEWSRTSPGNRRAHILEAEISRRGGAGAVEIYRAACRALPQKALKPQNDGTTRTTTSNH